LVDHAGYDGFAVLDQRHQVVERLPVGFVEQNPGDFKGVASLYPVRLNLALEQPYEPGHAISVAEGQDVLPIVILGWFRHRSLPGATPIVRGEQGSE
jgi:hypothetical protein